MKKLFLFSIFVLIISFSIFADKVSDVEKEKTAIKKIILESYRDGLAYGKVDLIAKGFHPGFNLLIKQKDHLRKLPIYEWKKYVEEKKEAGKIPPKGTINLKFLFIDIVGTAAVTKIEYYKDEKLAYTDFLSLYKFSDGWKLVAKIYHEH